MAVSKRGEEKVEEEDEKEERREGSELFCVTRQSLSARNRFVTNHPDDWLFLCFFLPLRHRESSAVKVDAAPRRIMILIREANKKRRPLTNWWRGRCTEGGEGGRGTNNIPGRHVDAAVRLVIKIREEMRMEELTDL